jgi:hypothetical protein
MDSRKYIGMDVHQEAISIAVLNASGKLVMESIIATKASTVVEFMQGLRGELHVTFEEGTWAAWLYDLLKPHVKKILVCNPRRNALLKEGGKSDRIDARKLAELLHANMLRPVPAGSMEHVRSSLSIDSGLPCVTVRSAPAIVLSRPAQRCRVKKWRRRDCRSSLAGALRFL